MGFGNIIYLVTGSAVVFLLTLLTVDYLRKKRQFLENTFSPEQRKKLLQGYDKNIGDLRHFLFLIALFLVFFALAGPQFGTKYMNIKKSGMDVVIAVDISKSMLAEDISPNRLIKARSELSALVDKIRGNRIGIVAFSGKAFLQCPLTLDTGAIKTIISILDAELIPVPGTAIAEAVDLACETFNRDERKYKALILLTDGEDHEGKVEQAVDRAKKEGVKIFTIGFGSATGELIPEKDAGGNVTGYKKDKSGKVISTRLDEETLQKTALSTGGRYFRASDGEIETSLLAEEINDFEKKLLKSRKFERYEEKFYYFAAAAFILLLIEWLL